MTGLHSLEWVEAYDQLPLKCTVKDAAKFLTVSHYTVTSLCKNKEITHHVVGRGKIIIMKEDLIEYMESKKCQREVKAPILNGGRIVRFGKSSSTLAGRGSATQRGLAALKRLSVSSENISPTAGQ